jgi:RNA polymerase sigma factor (sigma-70 family)
MASTETTGPGKAPGTVRDLVSPELRQNFKYIYGRLVAFGLGKGLPIEDVEELVQETLLRAWAKRGNYTPRPETSFVSWLLRVAQNLFVDRLRAGQVRHRVLEVMEHDQGSDHPTRTQYSSLADADAARRRDRLLLGLPEDLQSVFWVWVEQHDRGIDRDEAADRLGMTVEEYEAAKKRVRRAIEKEMEGLGYETEDLLSSGAGFMRLVAKGESA